ncbi:adhesin for cattle intestine colonization [Escherichia coli]|uniref:Adhesin for cattle intestine colonization n=1 Tax=Escherichia coli TaxID=562 RepID=A0A376VLR5_ECOLX|nr:adhesin for cattle intestine colonization [Escherichia coli]
MATGAQVTVTLNGHNYSATTDAAGNWTLTVPVSDLAALGQANYIVSASATSAAGNTASSQANLLVDSGLPGVTINTVAGDDIINAAEAGAGQTISGQVTGRGGRRYGHRDAGRQHLHHHGTEQLKLERHRSDSRSPGVGQMAI